MHSNENKHEMELRQSTEADLTEIETLALATHPELIEQREVFAEKLELFPEGCLVLVATDGSPAMAFRIPGASIRFRH